MIDLEVNDKPLVSVIVITYNSSGTIIETLESIKKQTYKNIELFITDDCSTDSTVSICLNWIDLNKARFTRAEVLTSDRNSGIPANCNRGLRKAGGQWLKFIAGDDKFMENAISDVIDYVIKNNEIKVLDSLVDIYNGDFSERIGQYDFSTHPFHRSGITANEQLILFSEILLGARIISTLGVFVKRELLINVGGFEEKYRLLEDSPMWWRVLKSNHKFYYLNKVTTCYRRHTDSVSYTNSVDYKVRIISDFQMTVISFIKECLYENISLPKKLKTNYIYYSYKLVRLLGNKGKVAEFTYKKALIRIPQLFSFFKLQ